MILTEKITAGMEVRIAYHPLERLSSVLRDMGECPDGLEIDRIDNNKGYEPGNCRWATHQQNCQNRGY